MCKYKDILGKPGLGFHKKRIVGLAYNDIIGTIIISFIMGLIKKYCYDKKEGNIITNTLLIFIVLFTVAQLLHAIFCVETEFIKMIKIYLV
jgi:uncharacterized membrane protein YeaQ/YmgE (transglycosylase-associated protein family)